jgi:hypothetical protein
MKYKAVKKSKRKVVHPAFDLRDRTCPIGYNKLYYEKNNYTPNEDQHPDCRCIYLLREILDHLVLIKSLKEFKR